MRDYSEKVHLMANVKQTGLPYALTAGRDSSFPLSFSFISPVPPPRSPGAPLVPGLTLPNLPTSNLKDILTGQASLGLALLLSLSPLVGRRLT